MKLCNCSIASLRTPVQPIITISLPSLLRYRRSWTCRRPTSLPCWACPTRRSGRSTARRGARSTAQGEAGTATPGRRSTPSQSPTSRRSTLWQWSVYYRVTIQLVQNLPLTSKQKFRFGLDWPGLARPKRNFCFEVNRRFCTS